MAWEFDARRAARDGRDLGEAGGFGRVGELTGTTAASFMAGVYRWMTLGLAVTAGVALYTASNVQLAMTVARNIWPLVIAQFLVVLALSFLAQRISGPVAALLFIVYAGAHRTDPERNLLHLHRRARSRRRSSSPPASFAALSIYGTVTKRDLSAWGTFLFMGLIGVVHRQHRPVLLEQPRRSASPCPARRWSSSPA